MWACRNQGLTGSKIAIWNQRRSKLPKRRLVTARQIYKTLAKRMRSLTGKAQQRDYLDLQVVWVTFSGTDALILTAAVIVVK